MSPVNTVDDYLAALPAEHKSALERIRATIKATAPEAAESISYGIPAFKYKGKPLIHFDAARDHCAVYGMRVMGAHEADLQPYDTAKGTIRFPPANPLPASLVKKLVKAQMKENETRASGYGRSRSQKSQSMS